MMGAKEVTNSVATERSVPQEIPHENELLKLVDAVRELERDFKLERGFNIFEALNITKQEIRHSRFLAYLLDPQESHGLGDRFLRRILMAAAENHPCLPVPRITLFTQELSNVTVYCERDHFDIAVDLPSLCLLFVIENKVDSHESENQLKNYKERANYRYPDRKFLGSFLTPDGYEGEDADWGALSYSQVVAEIRAILFEATPNADVLIAINHYINLVERNIVTSPALIDACKKIYRTHKAAFELIIEHGQETPLAMAFQGFSTNHSELEATTNRAGIVFFLHKDWKSITNANVADRGRWSSDFPVLFWFRLRDKKLQLTLEVGPILQKAGNERDVLVKNLRTEYSSNREKTSLIFTRVLSMSASLEEDPSSDDVQEAMESLWNKLEKIHGGAQPVTDIVKAWAVKPPSDSQ